jgi:hypothetical protein
MKDILRIFHEGIGALLFLILCVLLEIVIIYLTD